MIDITKTYRTRGGRPVRIYATDGKGFYPVHGMIDFGECQFIARWTNLGEHEQQTQYDLIEVKPRIVLEAWFNVYESGIGGAHENKNQADEKASHGRLACVKVTIDCEHGEGLE
jgi:hypothetical protein